MSPPVTRPLVSLASFVALALAASGCGSPEPRFASVEVSAAAPTATLSGRTAAAGVSAIALSPGCPGFVDPSAPEHVVHLTDASAITLSARSLEGPVAIAVVGGGEVRCDADGGSGHVPTVTVSVEGEYQVFVGALAAPADYAYELRIAPAAAGDDGTGSRGATRVAVTITSEPSGATVRTPEGETLGSTPLMFAIPVAAAEVGSERRFVLEMPGRTSAEVSGRLVGGTMVLHATLLPAAGAVPPDAGVAPAVSPVVVSGSEMTATVAVGLPITDYRTTTGRLSVTEACTIGRASVDLDISHSYVGDLRVTLVSPAGTEVVLHDHGGAGRRDLRDTIDWDSRSGALRALAGQSTVGTWEVRVRDDAGADTGTFRAFTLRFSCGDATASTPSGGGTGGGTSGGRRPRPRPPLPPPGGTVINPWPPTPTPTPTPVPPPVGDRRNGPRVPPP